MSSTSSDEPAYGPAPIGSDSANEEEEDATAVRRHDGLDRERKRPRLSDYRADPYANSHSVRRERYGNSRSNDAESGRKRGRGDGRSKARSLSSRDPSPATQSLPQPRMGKRMRRAPQRWDGERRDRFYRNLPSSYRGRDADSGSYVNSDGEDTLSINSAPDDQGPPKIDDPFKDLRDGIKDSIATLNRRTIVDTFHSWQLRAVSKQAAQQKALHVYLKRKLRKRTTKAPEIDRLEDDALRNARNATFKRSASRPGEHGDHYPTTVEDDASQLVPSEMRLSLEAYLPRRVRAGFEPQTSEQVLSNLAPRPHLPGSPLAEASSDTQKWLPVPTVVDASSLNKSKSNARFNAARAFKV